LDRAVEALEKSDPPITRCPAPAAEDSPPRVIPVDIFGLPADYTRSRLSPPDGGIAVIETPPSPSGANTRGERPVPSAISLHLLLPRQTSRLLGDAECFTDDDPTAEILRSIRVHGQGNDKYENVRIGINGRLDSLQAAILLAKFTIFPEEIELPRKSRSATTRCLPVRENPEIPTGYRSAWRKYSILVRDSAERSGLMAKLKEAGIPTAVYYPSPPPPDGFCRPRYREGTSPVSDECASRSSVSMHPYLAPGTSAASLRLSISRGNR